MRKADLLYRFFSILILTCFLCGNSFGQQPPNKSADEDEEYSRVLAIQKKYEDTWMAIPGVNSVGTIQCGNKHCILITVVKLTDEHKKKLPKKIEGVTVKVKEIGEIHFL
jgi:hypothetical protein